MFPDPQAHRSVPFVDTAHLYKPAAGKVGKGGTGVHCSVVINESDRSWPCGGGCTPNAGCAHRVRYNRRVQGNWPSVDKVIIPSVFPVPAAVKALLEPLVVTGMAIVWTKGAG